MNKRRSCLNAKLPGVIFASVKFFSIVALLQTSCLFVSLMHVVVFYASDLVLNVKLNLQLIGCQFDPVCSC